jgi:hypothetical protein
VCVYARACVCVVIHVHVCVCVYVNHTQTRSRKGKREGVIGKGGWINMKGDPPDGLAKALSFDRHSGR